MPIAFLNFLEVVLNGLMVGVLYALVALGFVLIFKASGIFNFAQGVMALFAALTLVGLQQGQVPFHHLINATFGTSLHDFGWTLPVVLAILLTVGVMILLAVRSSASCCAISSTSRRSSSSWRRSGSPISSRGSAT
jgi:branched-chain amino acid transport system permease protein